VKEAGHEGKIAYKNFSLQNWISTGNLSSIFIWHCLSDTYMGGRL